MSSGGARAGSGRKRGSVIPQTKRKLELIQRAAEAGLTPLEVLLKGMRDALDSGNIKEACFFAKDAAPYVHPKLATIQHQGDENHPLTFKICEVSSGVPRVHMNGHANGHDAAR